MDLLQKADQKYKEAKEILETTNIQEFFRDAGKIELVGSYTFNAMLRNDIDFFVLSDRELSQDTANRITFELLNTKQFQTVGLADCLNYDVHKVKGYYWEIIYYLHHERWKFDIWYANINSEKLSNIIGKRDQLVNKLKGRDDLRLQILEEKQNLLDNPTTKKDKYDIYERILNTN
jgi:hypothetical protein